MLPIICNGARIGYRPGESVQVWHSQRVALANSGKRLIESWPGPFRFGRSMINIEFCPQLRLISECFPLGRKVLFVREALCVADESLWHNCTKARIRPDTDRGFDEKIITGRGGKLILLRAG